MGKPNHRISSGLWAWMISLGLHGVLLGGFALMRIPSEISEVRGDRGAVVSLEAVSRVIDSEPIAPKPALRPILSENPRSNPSAVSAPPVPTDIPMSSPDAVTFSEDLIGPSADFFGSRLAADRICFVTDCSGSMFGRMGLVRGQLTRTIGNLSANQFFSVLFFREGQIILESGSGSLQRASASSKQKAIRLIESVRPGGRTEALSALQRAMELRTPGGERVELIYFLTDGFDLDESGAAFFLHQAETLRKKLAPGVIIHTIGFWTEPEDRRILELLAAQTGGTFIPVESGAEE